MQQLGVRFALESLRLAPLHGHPRNHVVKLTFDSGSVDGLWLLSRVQGRTYCSACSSGSRETLGAPLRAVLSRSAPSSQLLLLGVSLTGWLSRPEEVFSHKSTR